MYSGGIIPTVSETYSYIFGPQSFSEGISLDYCDTFNATDHTYRTGTE